MNLPKLKRIQRWFWDDGSETEEQMRRREDVALQTAKAPPLDYRSGTYHQQSWIKWYEESYRKNEKITDVRLSRHKED